jgi:hypothetical protein
MAGQAVLAYFAALERLKQNKPERVPKGGVINKDTVAIEAGRARGSIRSRPGFKRLLAAIEEAQGASPKRRGTLNDKARIEKARSAMDDLKIEHEKLKARYMSLLFLNYEMARKLRDAGIESPKFGFAVELQIDEKLPF